jgi:hypothetical protein
MLMTPVNKYGKMYKIFSGDEDSPIIEYTDMVDVDIAFNPQLISFEVMFDGYSGFKSKISEKIFKSRYQWDAYSILFVSPAEHLIDGNRYDMELQINHVPFLTEVEKEAAAAAQALSGGGGDHRRLQDDTLTADGKPKEDVFAITSLLFSVNDYRPVNATTKAAWDNFWTQLDFTVGTSPRLDFS